MARQTSYYLRGAMVSSTLHIFKCRYCNTYISPGKQNMLFRYNRSLSCPQATSNKIWFSKLMWKRFIGQFYMHHIVAPGSCHVSSPESLETRLSVSTRTSKITCSMWLAFNTKSSWPLYMIYMIHMWTYIYIYTYTIYLYILHHITYN